MSSKIGGEDLIQPVILSGGSGTRLWPLSRAAYPKQFQALAATQSLLQETA
ncbi:MAG: sugar phosphate nucleotidyltransferase, partial [Rhodospirillales bacterium]|nr:sugar phosphate nucleotidyltransferase [Rhodospirillales bacterium]